MAFTVTTYNSESELATALIASVVTYNSEAALQVGLDAAFSLFGVVAKGGKFTLIDNPELANITLTVLGKGGKFTVIHET